MSTRFRWIKVFLCIGILIGCLYLLSGSSPGLEGKQEEGVEEEDGVLVFEREDSRVKSGESLREGNKEVRLDTSPEKSRESPDEGNDEGIPRKKIFDFHRVTKVMGMNPFIQNAFQILDHFQPSGKQGSEPFGENNPNTYAMFKSMVMSWNMEASKWALNASSIYKALLETPANGEPFYRDFDSGVFKKNISLGPCGCIRETPSRPIGGNNVLPEDSTCSPHAFERGPHQRVIGFSFYGSPDSKIGKERKYFQGILDNLSLIPKYYPGWTLRLYYDLPKASPLLHRLCETACSNPNLDLCHVRSIPSEGDISDIFPMNWRFLPILDPMVDSFVSRDLDSRINAREAAAVAEWLQGDKAFHFMRDHPAHSIEVLGSGWGLRLRDLERSMVFASFQIATKDSIFWATRDAYGPDQGILKRYLWPWGKWNSISHDAYSCAHFARTSPFPTQRKIEPNNFIAAVVSANDTLLAECPLKCRKDPSWIYC